MKSLHIFSSPMIKSTSWLVLIILLVCLGMELSCSEKVDPFVNARRVSTRTDLIGGPSALGEIGDFVMENSRIKVIIQDQGFSRGFGVYGGGRLGGWYHNRVAYAVFPQVNTRDLARWSRGMILA